MASVNGPTMERGISRAETKLSVLEHSLDEAVTHIKEAFAPVLTPNQQPAGEDQSKSPTPISSNFDSLLDKHANVIVGLIKEIHQIASRSCV